MKQHNIIRTAILTVGILTMSLFAFAQDGNGNSNNNNNDPYGNGNSGDNGMQQTQPEQQQQAQPEQPQEQQQPQQEQAQQQEWPQRQEQPQQQSSQYPQSQQSQTSQQPQQSQGPQPGVGRISYIHGDVSTQRGDNSGWGSARLNVPLVAGDEISTGEKSRTEVQLDYANLMRLADNSQAKVLDVTRTHIRIQIDRGLVDYSTFTGGEAEIEIDTPNMSIHSPHPGNYRIQVNSNGETVVTVRVGEAEIATQKGSTRLKEGEEITVRGTEDPEYHIARAQPTDEWDKWNTDRDHRIKNAESWRYSNRYYTGAQDLDAYGQWSEVPGYGRVWSPRAGPDWAPYRDGNWVWEPYYGWTWVSYEPWGWAPYHYGRWFVYGSSWCWWPGPVFVGYRPLWAPAYVSFFGFGRHAGVSVGFGFGSVGWLPLGPFDGYRPWWNRGFGYRSVNVINVTNINVRNVNTIGPLGIRGRQPFYSNLQAAGSNDRVRGGFSSVRTEEFGHVGGAGHMRTVDASTFRGATSFNEGARFNESARFNEGGRGNEFHGSAQGNISRGNDFGGNRNGGANISAQMSQHGSQPANGGGNNNGWQRFSSNPSNGGSNGGGRQPLDLNKQMVSPRTGSNGGNFSSGAGNSPNYGNGRASNNGGSRGGNPYGPSNGNFGNGRSSGNSNSSIYNSGNSSHGQGGSPYGGGRSYSGPSGAGSSRGGYSGGGSSHGNFGGGGSSHGNFGGGSSHSSGGGGGGSHGGGGGGSHSGHGR